MSDHDSSGQSSPRRPLSAGEVGVAALLFAVGGTVHLTASAPSADAHIAPFHTHHPRVKHTILEQFGVTATETDATGTVTQDDKPSIGEPTVSWSTYHSSFPTWHRPRVQSIANKTGTKGDGVAQIGVEVDWRHSTGVATYTMRSYYNKRASEGDTYGCVLPRGELPWFWSSQCAAWLDGRRV